METTLFVSQCHRNGVIIDKKKFLNFSVVKVKVYFFQNGVINNSITWSGGK